MRDEEKHPTGLVHSADELQQPKRCLLKEKGTVNNS